VVEGLGGAEVGELLGTSGHGVFEVQGVGQVELTVDPAGAGEGHLVMGHREVPLIRGPLPPLGGVLGHERRDCGFY